MAKESNYLFFASMDVNPDKDDLFHEVYNTEHVPLLQTVPGVLSVARFQKEEFTLIIGGESRTVNVESEPRYTAMYKIESPEVLKSIAWGEAVDSGRWPDQVRPYTSNRRHVLMKRISS